MVAKERFECNHHNQEEQKKRENDGIKELVQRVTEIFKMKTGTSENYFVGNSAGCRKGDRIHET